MTRFNSRARAARRAALCLSTVLACGVAMPALAQSAPAPEQFRNNDEHGVDLATGTFNPEFVEGDIGRPGEGIKLVRYWGQAGYRDNWSGALQLTGAAGSRTATLTFGNTSEVFTESGGSWVNIKANGAKLTSAYGLNGWVYSFTDKDGTQISYNSSTTFIGSEPQSLWFAGVGCSAQVDFGGTGADCALPVSIVDPDGSKYSLTWKVPTQCTYDEELNATCSVGFRLQDVRSKASYAMKLKYASNAYPNSNFGKRTGAKFYDLGQVYCDPNALNCDSVTAVNTVSYANPNANTTQVTDERGGTWTLTTNASGQLSGIRRPGQATDTTTVTYNPAGRVGSITDNGETKTYTWGTSGSNTTVATTTGAGETTTIMGAPVWIGPILPITETDAYGNVTSTTYDGNGRVTRVTSPEGNYTNFTYDTRENLLETRVAAKSGSGLPDIVATASFDASCANPAKCNKPNYTIDAKGNRTDYTYDPVHGGVTRVQMPAATTGGVRPEINYTYSAQFAGYRDAGGNLVAPSTPEYKVTQITSCSTAATCPGTVNETKVTMAYNTPNLQVTSVTVANGTGTLSSTTTYTYDGADNLKTVDGPLAGTDDTTTYFYDAYQRTTGVIGPDPDGGGSRQRPVERYTYDAESRITRKERGWTNAATDAALATMTVADFNDITYDAKGNVIKIELKSGTTVYAVTQFAYDVDNRLTCTAVRMNPAAFASLPADACTASTLNVANGPDRISKKFYDANGRVIKVQTALGQPEQADEGTMTYTPNSQLASVKDAEANLTSYDYDGFDRMVKTRFPVTTQGAAASNASDYVQIAYDAASQVVDVRLRDGRHVLNAYDNLGRLTYQDRPTGELDWSATYDLSGRPTLIQDSSGGFVGYAYDALGRQTAESSPLGVFGKGYDAAGRFNLLVYPDNFYVNYDYDVAGNVTAIRESGATSGPGLLASYTYDNLGRRTAVTRGNGTSSSYSFDAVSRLTALGQNLSGSANDLTIGSITYNPAGQITSQVKSNDAYAWTGHYNVNRSYTVNGLNQMATAGTTPLGYDLRGNLTTSGSNTYGYDSLNRLTSGPGTTLGYDPLDRLAQVTGASGTTRFGYAGSQLLLETNAAGTVLRRYVAGPGVDEPLVWYEGAGITDRRWLHADERGSVVAVSDGAGAMLGINRYDEYGVPQASNAGRFGYTGQAWIPELGLWHYKARAYAPTLGRFMQTDPIGYGDGLNWYNYVGGDPVNYADPSGMTGSSETTTCTTRIANYTTWFYDYNRDGVPQPNEVAASLPNYVAECNDGGERVPGSDGRNLVAGGEGDIVVYGIRPKSDEPSTLEKLGQCTLNQLGLGEVASAAAAAAGIPQEGSKRFVTEGSSRGTSALSRGLAEAFPERVGDTRIGQALGTKRIWTPKLGQIRRFTPIVGRAAGRLIPVVGAALLVADAVQIGMCVLDD